MNIRALHLERCQTLLRVMNVLTFPDGSVTGHENIYDYNRYLVALKKTVAEMEEAK